MKSDCPCRFCLDSGRYRLVWLALSNALQVSIPHEPFNAAVRDGTAGQKLSRIVDETKPEVVYFTEQHGQRGAIMIVEMSDPSKIPTLAEPWFLTFNASVEFRVVMTPDDLQKAGLDEVGKKWA
jgi:hypothetical protein